MIESVSINLLLFGGVGFRRLRLRRGPPIRALASFCFIAPRTADSGFFAEIFKMIGMCSISLRESRSGLSPVTRK